jgi:SAM-dependent methyltransferase
MKFAHKLRKLGDPLTYTRAWRRVEQRLDPIPVKPLLEKIDQARLREIQARYAASSEHYAKYLNSFETFFKRNVRRIQYLNLHRSPPADLLDLGCGAGFFLFVAKQFGHRCLGLDTDDDAIFSELMRLFDLPRVIWRIKAFEPLPDFEKSFDWITAFSTAFQGAREDSWRWGAAEWKFFLDDLERRLKPGGRIFFGLNPSYDGKYYTTEILDLFLSHGAKVERENVLFPPKR